MLKCRGSKLAQFYDVKSLEVYEAIYTMKSGKMDDTVNLCSDNFINSNYDVCVL